MRYVKRTVCGLIVVAALLSAGFMIARMMQDDSTAAAQSGGQWEAASLKFFCADCFISVDDDGNMIGQPQAGIPDGRPDIFVNFIARLDRDGCEWQWDTMSWSGPDLQPILSYMVLYRC